jgi:hypothetical protein
MKAHLSLVVGMLPLAFLPIALQALDSAIYLELVVAALLYRIPV